MIRFFSKLCASNGGVFFFSSQEERKYLRMCPFFMQQSDILKWFISSLFIWAVVSHWSRGRNVLSSFLSKWLLHGDSPPGSAPHSRDEWFISHVVNEMVFAGVCLHKTPFMFDDSETQQISHLPQRIIFSPQVPLMWRVTSGPAAPSTHGAGRSFLTVCAQECDTQIESSAACPEFPPSPRCCNQHHTINTEASWVTPNTKTEIFALDAAVIPPKRVRNQHVLKLTCLPWRSRQPQRLIFVIWSKVNIDGRYFDLNIFITTQGFNYFC